jgi:protein TonB
MKDHKLMYGIYLRAGLLSSVLVFILGFLLIPYAEPKPYELKRDIVTLVEEISAQIDRYEEPPPVERPKVAIEAEKDVGEDKVVETMADAVWKDDLIRTIPTGPEIEIVPYYKVEVKPRVIVQVKPRYPSIIAQAGIEGTTVVKVLVDIDGSIMEVQVLKSSGNQMLDQEALAAARKWKFSPAKQRDKFVRVYISIPMEFKLVDQS